MKSIQSVLSEKISDADKQIEKVTVSMISPPKKKQQQQQQQQQQQILVDLSYNKIFWIKDFSKGIFWWKYYGTSLVHLNNMLKCFDNLALSVNGSMTTFAKHHGGSWKEIRYLLCEMTSYDGKLWKCWIHCYNATFDWHKFTKSLWTLFQTNR